MMITENYFIKNSYIQSVEQSKNPILTLHVECAPNSLTILRIPLDKQ